jgi:hypothetical protein
LLWDIVFSTPCARAAAPAEGTAPPAATAAAAAVVE